MSNELTTDLRVLVVDDHPAQRRLLVEMLKRLGHSSVEQAGSGQEAVALLDGAAKPFDLVVTDLNMPDGDGLDVIGAIQRGAHSLEVVLLTAADSTIVSALQRLPDSINGSRVLTVPKPMKLPTLDGICRGAVRKRQESAGSGDGVTVEELRAALADRSIVAYLEPQVDLRLGTVVGFEALARWHHPTRGVVAPYFFIDLAERSGLMRDLTLRVLESALDSVNRLRSAGYEGGISVNFGASCLEDQHFHTAVTEVMARAGLPRADLTLELTETSQITDSVVEISSLARLRLAGMNLALDDFGMGHSSLDKLQRGAFNEIKIDREFTRRVAGDRICRAAVHSIVTLARSLDVVCVAEGIEDELTRSTVAQMGCDIGQGYLFSRPIAPDRVVDWWSTWRSTTLGDSLGSAPSHSSEAPQVVADGPSATLDARSLARLEQRNQPAWIFDLDRCGMVWANAAGLAFWKAASLRELRERDFNGDMTIATRQRLQSYRGILSNGRPRAEQWTMFPGGSPVTVDCLLTGLFRLSGESSMLVEASPAGSLGTAEHYPADCARGAAVPVMLADLDGLVVWQNPCSAVRFGTDVRHCESLLGGKEQTRQMLARTLETGEWESTQPDGTMLLVRRTRDSKSGKPMLVITVA